METNTDNALTREEIVNQNHPRLTSEELRTLFSDTTTTARYFYANKWYIAKCNSFSNGFISGQNHVGTYDEGTWKVNNENHSVSLEWEGYWENWTAHVYKVNDEYIFFNTDNGTWRMTITSVEQGELAIDDI